MGFVPRGPEGILTFDAMILDVCTLMLYSAEPTVRVRTEPALRLVIATVTCASDNWSF